MASKIHELLFKCKDICSEECESDLEVITAFREGTLTARELCDVQGDYNIPHILFSAKEFPTIPQRVFTRFSGGGFSTTQALLVSAHFF